MVFHHTSGADGTECDKAARPERLNLSVDVITATKCVGIPSNTELR
jgi:hypothetical protein